MIYQWFVIIAFLLVNSILITNTTRHHLLNLLIHKYVRNGVEVDVKNNRFLVFFTLIIVNFKLLDLKQLL